jgi:endonuclease-3
MAAAKKPFQKVIAKLKKYFGEPRPPKTTDPFAIIVFDNIAYLVDDTRREAAFDLLRKTVGLQPVDILAAPVEKVISATKLGGIHPEPRAYRLKECAQIVLNDFGGDLNQALTLPLPKAIKALRQFPSIGEPGAEKILLFTRTYPVLALESNGLRVMLRLGFGEEKKNYSASYKSVKEAVTDQIGNDCDYLIETHQLLRRHGKEICKTTNPHCDDCPINSFCAYYANL